MDGMTTIRRPGQPWRAIGRTLGILALTVLLTPGTTLAQKKGGKGGGSNGGGWQRWRRPATDDAAPDRAGAEGASRGAASSAQGRRPNRQERTGIDRFTGRRAGSGRHRLAGQQLRRRLGGGGRQGDGGWRARGQSHAGYVLDRHHSCDARSGARHIYGSRDRRCDRRLRHRARDGRCRSDRRLDGVLRREAPATSSDGPVRAWYARGGTDSGQRSSDSSAALRQA